MSSLNVPVPGELKRLANDLYPKLGSFETVRERHTLVAKRVPDGDWETPATVRERIRPVVAATPPLDLSATGVDVFWDPPTGSAPVVYLAVDSPDLERVHRRLCEVFPAVDGMEGDDYVPHVTLARGGSREAAERLQGTEVDAVDWTAGELELWSGEYREAVERVRLRG